MRCRRPSKCYKAWTIGCVFLVSIAYQYGAAAQGGDPVEVMQQVNDRWMQDNPVPPYGNADWIRAIYHIGNIAQYKRGLPVGAVTAMGTQDPPPDDNCCAPENTIDNDPTTRWSAFGDSQNGEEISITYDLGRVRPVSHVRIAWFRGNQRMAFFDIQTSIDNENWDTVVLDGESSGNTLEQEIVPFDETLARYVKYIGRGNTVSNWNSITEFDVSREKYYARSKGWAEANNWMTFSSQTRGDHIASGQTYIELYKLDPVDREELWIENIKDAVDGFTQSVLSISRCGRLPNPDMNPSTGIRWIDEIFMALPNFSKLGDLFENGDVDYWARMFDFYGIQRDADSFVGDTRVTRGLYDSNRHLWYRDEHYKPNCSRGGDTGVFWSRGNGWVFAGLAQMLETLPSDPSRSDRVEYETDFKNMAAALKSRQRLEGYWPTDLDEMDIPTEYECGETSGTALFAYGLAWGINHGLLDRAEYGDTVNKAWNWLTSDEAIGSGDLDGVLLRVQDEAEAPVRCSALVDTREDETELAVGAFLLAGSEVAKLEIRLPVVSTSANRWQEPNVPDNTIDDDLDPESRWSCFNDGIEDDCYIRFDLGSVFDVQRVEIAFFRGDERIARFGLEASVDGVNWTPVLTPETPSSGNTLQPEPFPVGMQAQYLRYTGQGNSGNSWVSLTEFHVYEQPVSPPPDRIPVVSTSADRWQEPNVPDNTIDDDLDPESRWSCFNDGIEDDCYIKFDLGSVFDVQRVEIAFFRGDERIARFGLEASVDGVNWTPVLTPETPSSGNTLQPEPFPVGMQAQYLRYTGQGNSGNSWVSLTEFQVYGIGP